MVFPSSHVQQDTILALQKELLDIFTAPGVQKKLREIRDSGAAGWKNGLRDGESRGGEAFFFAQMNAVFCWRFGQSPTGCDPRDGLKNTLDSSRYGFWMFLDVFGPKNWRVSN
jgi:hypothetical protein